MTIIDAHHHLWDRSRAHYPFLGPQIPQLDRDIGFEELAPHLSALGIDATVLVQSSGSDADTDFLIEQAAAHPQIAAIVGWVPLDDQGRASARLEHLRAVPAFAGIRAGIHREPDANWILRPDVSEGLDLLAQHDVPFDLVPVRRRHLELVPELMERHDGLRVVIDHISKPPVKKDDREPWWTNLRRAADHPNVYAKLSGLFPARGELGDWTVDDLRPFIDHAVECFGPSRLMWGSDWPIVNLAGGYERMFHAFMEIFAGWSSADREAVLCGTAAHFYGLTDVA